MKTSIPKITNVKPKGNVKLLPQALKTEVQEYLLEGARMFSERYGKDLDSFVLVAWTKDRNTSIRYYTESFPPEVLPSYVEEHIRCKIFGEE